MMIDKLLFIHPLRVVIMVQSFNLSGIFGVFKVLKNPQLIIPHMNVNGKKVEKKI